MNLSERLELLRAKVWSGEHFADEEFDAIYDGIPAEMSSIHWSPVEVALKAARFLEGSDRILDVGSGGGKFCLLAGLLLPQTQVTGVEYRPSLVARSRFLSRKFGLRNVRFISGDAMRLDWNEFDGLYLFNPFQENLFSESALHYANADEITLSQANYSYYVEETRRRLARLPVGTRLALYAGFDTTSKAPPAFKVESSETIQGCRLELARRRC